MFIVFDNMLFALEDNMIVALDYMFYVSDNTFLC